MRRYSKTTMGHAAEKSRETKRKTKGCLAHPATSDREYTSAESEFMFAMDEFKRRTGRLFPTCSDVLSVLNTLGYKQNGQTLPVCGRVGHSEPEAGGLGLRTA